MERQHQASHQPARQTRMTTSGPGPEPPSQAGGGRAWPCIQVHCLLNTRGLMNFERTLPAWLRSYGR